MGYVFDLLILLTLSCTAYHIFSRSFKENILGLFGLLWALAFALGLFRILLVFHSFLPSNVLFKSGVLCGLPLLFSGLSFGLFHRYILSTFRKRFHSSFSHGACWKRWTANVALFFAVLLYYGFLVDLTFPFLQVSPQRKSLLRQSTVLRLGQRIQTSLLMEKDFEPLDASKRKVVPRSLLKQQELALHALRKSLGDARTFLMEKSGGRQLSEFADMTKTLVELSDEEKVWLFEVTPELQAIADNASIKAVFRDEELLTTMWDASQGSLSDVYALSEHEAIQALFEDPELLNLLRQIRLPELLQKVIERRELSDNITLSDSSLNSVATA